MAYTSDVEGELLRQVVIAKGGSQPVLDSVNHFYRYRIAQNLSTYHLVTIDQLIGVFKDPIIARPTINDLKGEGISRKLWPYECRRNGLSYMAQLFAKFQLHRYVDGKLVPISDEVVDVHLGKIPAIIQSDVCHLYGLTAEERYAQGEPEKDPGAYAIIKGAEKVLLNIENLRTSEAFLYEDKEEFTVRYTSQSLNDTTVNIIKEDKDDVHVTFSKMGISNNSINVFFIFYILGFQTNIAQKVYSLMDSFIVDEDPVRENRRRIEMRNYMQVTENTFYTLTGGGDQEQVYIKLSNRFTDKNIITSPNRNNLIMDLIWRELFKDVPLNYRDFSELTPNHMSGLAPILATKARMLASMVVKYVDFKNGYRQPDDRDAWGNKQLVDPGKHLSKAFARIWRSMILSLQNKITSNRSTKAAQIKNLINQNYMTEQFINAYNKELFITGKGQRETAIVDTLKRDNILSAIAHIRRISTPTNRRAKIRDKRLIHNTQWGVVCPVMTPEGEACLNISTPVLLANGNEIPIRDLKDGDEVMTIDPITLQQSVSKITNHFIKSSEEYGKPILKITTLNGREIICTDDHPFLTQYGWIYAKDLDLDKHLVAIYPVIQPIPHIVLEPEIILDENIITSKLQFLKIKASVYHKHIQDLQDLKLLPLRSNDQRLPIISRIAGFLLADGSLSINKRQIPTSSYCFGTQYDGDLFLQDMERLGFTRNKLSYKVNTITDKITGRESTHHTWNTSYSNCFASLLLALDLTYGKRTTKESNPIPKWIQNGSLAMKREFIAGFQGGDGSKMMWTKRHDKVKAGKFNFSRTLQHKSSENIESLVIFMNQLADIFTELGIEILDVKKNSDNVRIDFSDKEENILKYMNIIGYRYATTKSTESYQISEYLKYKQNKIQERVELKQKIHELTLQGLKPSQIAINLNLRVRQVTSILEYKGNNGTLAPKDIIGFQYWIDQTLAKNNCIYMPIQKIENSPSCMVADFTTVSENHSMISNGFVTHNCGLVKDTAITTYVSLNRDESVIKSYLDGNQITRAQYSVIPTAQLRNPLYLNGIHIGFCNSVNLRENLLHLRRTQQIYFDTGIVLDRYNELKIFTNEGRLCRPLLVVDKDTQELVIDIKNLRNSTLDTLMAEGAIEYIDIVEQEQVQLLIAEHVRNIRMKRDELATSSAQYERLRSDPTSTRQQINDSLLSLQRQQNRKRYTHCEIDPTVIMGISAISMPFAEFNPGPRDTYQASMVRQALGGNSARIELRFDTTMKTILEPGVPTVSTDAHEYLGLDEYPSGRELVIAITTYGGSNQEDAITFNKAAIDLGLFLMMIYHSYKTTICQSTKHQERVVLPVAGTHYPRNQAERYSKLDPETGIVRLGEYVKSGDCLVGKLIINADGQAKNDSLFVDVGKEGIVDEVYVTENAENCKLIRIRLRELRKLQPGDKLASRYSQKGTIGEILPEKDMPWIVSDIPYLNGVRPHIIFNPHGIPSRMTMGKLNEILVGKLTSITGERFNATAFRRFGQPNKPGESEHDNIYTIKDQLERLGFSRSGKDKMVNGITGREMDVEIYTGTAYYQLLRHLVKDKMQARGTGTVQFLTRQPTSGIRKEGGLRLGEMERDSLLEYGASYLQQERMSISSDAYQAIVCRDCGMFAATNMELGVQRCRKCPNGTFTRVNIPYAFKLLVHYLAAANMRVTLRTKEI